MHRIFNQPERFFVTAKMHRFDTTEDINVTDLKLRSISSKPLAIFRIVKKH